MQIVCFSVGAEEAGGPGDCSVDKMIGNVKYDTQKNRATQCHPSSSNDLAGWELPLLLLPSAAREHQATVSSLGKDRNVKSQS